MLVAPAALGAAFPCKVEAVPGVGVFIVGRALLRASDHKALVEASASSHKSRPPSFATFAFAEVTFDRMIDRI
jgi:hypothetical protein